MSLVEGPSPTRLQRFLAYRLLLVLGLVTLAADQLSKGWIAARLPFPTYGEPGAIRIVDDFLYLVHVGNTGAAWSLFTGRSTLLAGLAAATLVAIVFWRNALGLRTRVVQVSFGLLCGGISGNLTDRLLHGHVIDFLDFHFGSYIYPTFNVADSAICVGVFLYIVWSLRQPATDNKVPRAD
jgi:signal peptidase II